MSLLDQLIAPESPSPSNLKMINLKKSIISRLMMSGESTISKLCKETGLSIPTVTKMVNQLLADEILLEQGKSDSFGGRKSTQYDINPKIGYFLGVDVQGNTVNIGIQNFKNEFVKITERIPYTLENTRESLRVLCGIINSFIDEAQVSRDEIFGACVNLTGRINSFKGFSYSYFFFEEMPLSEIIESQIGIKTFLENDSRAMTYGEYSCGVVEKEKNVIFVNLTWGLGIGIINDGQLYYGKSGYSGEFGHSPVFENEIICQCGKKGCLETEISALALERRFKEKLESGSVSVLKIKKGASFVSMEEIIAAIVEKEDSLAIEIIEEIGVKLGRYLSMLINIFNPELVVLGGPLAAAGSYLFLPTQSTINKYSLNIVIQDMELKLSKLGSKAGVIGACYILRNKFLMTL